jgi:hypothetical protein
MNVQESDSYCSYLLRLWRGCSEAGMVWQASLESAQTGQRYVFSNLEELVEFLFDQTHYQSLKDDKQG